MRRMSLCILTALAGAWLGGSDVHAAFADSPQVSGSPNCTKPPYGASHNQYQAYEDSFEKVVPASHIFPVICRAKFENGDRETLHLLGLTDEQINQDSVADLAVALLTAIKAQMNSAPAEQSPEQPSETDGIYVPFTCVRQTGTCDAVVDYTFTDRASCEQYVQSVGLADESQPTYMHCFFRANPWQP